MATMTADLLRARSPRWTLSYAAPAAGSRRSDRRPRRVLISEAVRYSADVAPFVRAPAATTSPTSRRRPAKPQPPDRALRVRARS
jgi:hypothetical protein